MFVAKRTENVCPKNKLKDINSGYIGQFFENMHELLKNLQPPIFTGKSTTKQHTEAIPSEPEPLLSMSAYYSISTPASIYIEDNDGESPKSEFEASTTKERQNFSNFTFKIF